MNLVVAITGATGVYAAKVLIETSPWPVTLVASEQGRTVYEQECGAFDPLAARAAEVYADSDLTAPIASGSFPTRGMVILPCTANTLGKIAQGIGDTLITRTAQVALKERFKLVICVRETPLSTVTLEQCARLSRDGAIIMPISPPLYFVPKSVDEYVQAFVDKVLAVVGFRESKGWRSEELE